MSASVGLISGPPTCPQDFQHSWRSEPITGCYGQPRPGRDGRGEIPSVGLGLFRCPPGRDTQRLVIEALRLGYRMFDTSSSYGNERDLGQALKETSTLRSDVFICSKIWASDASRMGVSSACQASLDRLETDFVDLLLVHTPVPAKQRVDTWRGMEDMLAQGKAKSIGVSNFGIAHLEALFNDPHCQVKPAVNQIELSPFHPNRDLVKYCAEKGIKVMAFAPLTNAATLDDRRLLKIGRKHEKTSCEVLLAWVRRRNYVCTPKACDYGHLAENLECINHAGEWLTDEDMEWMETFCDVEDPIAYNSTQFCELQASP